MYDCIRAGSLGSSVFFIILVLLGNIIMINLFLAILLGNFEKARIQKRKQIIFEAFKLLLDAGYSLNKQLDFILGD